ncbi:Mitochondrial GTPase 1 [Paramicrosporidium saccamoebae]|uniref:Mitochondrial GTPase 1 n=1 Tax=Paramicrosporidium saccamoebae TaxID=1246581 RepID=A0A2H9TNU9_9FUNG|nr:Mitochondrial GTPase 1 [Paramicrosporidium saccamoebae]
MTFLYDMSKISLHWFPSHMKAGLTHMQRLLKRCDVVLDVRDARIHAILRVNVLSYRELLHKVAYMVRKLPNRERTRLMVVGMPNVGKSTVINRLRSLGINKSTKAVCVGDRPGITRAVSGVVRILDEPLTFLYDSPGILMPKITSAEQGMKLAVTGNSIECAFSLYYKTYLDKFQLTAPPTDTVLFLEHLSRVLGNVNNNSTPNVRNTVSWLMKTFRSGEIGKFTLDEIP